MRVEKVCPEAIPCTPQEALAILERHCKINIDMDRVNYHYATGIIEARLIEGQLASILGVPSVDLTNKDLNAFDSKFNIVDNTMSALDIMQGILKIPSGVNLPELEDVLINYADNELVSSIVGLMKIGIKKRTGLSPLKQFRECGQDVWDLTWDRYPSRIFHMYWELLVTNRFQAKNPNFQQITREYQDIISPPAGYVYVSSDTGQVDPTIMYSTIVKDPLLKYLINLYKDVYFGMYHYLTLPAKTLESFREGMELEKLEVDKAKRNHMKTLTNAANYGATNFSKFKDIPKEVADLFLTRIVKHPMRVAFLDKVFDRYVSGVRTAKTAFGTVLNIPEPDNKNKDEDSLRNYLGRTVTAYCIQGTAADLTRLSIYTADKILAADERAYIAGFVHDNGIFAIPDDNPELAEACRGLMAYSVADWIDIREDYEIIGEFAS